MQCPQVMWPEWRNTLLPQVLKMFRSAEDERHAALLIVSNLVKGIHTHAATLTDGTRGGDAGSVALVRDAATLERLPGFATFVAQHLVRSCQDASAKVRVAGMDCLCLFCLLYTSPSPRDRG